jgi:hypothetical protein
MFKLSDWIMPPGKVRLTRDVEEGRVFCPVQAEDVDVERCFACPSFQDAVSSGKRLPDRIVCNPKLGSMAGNASM